MHRISMTLIAATLITGLTACGGGGRALPTNTGSQLGLPTQPAQTQSATAQMTVFIPAHTTAAGFRNPKYISAGTQSMTVATQSGSPATQLAEADLTPSSPNCAVVTGGGTQCNVTFIGTAGTATYVVSMYDQIGGKGNVLSTASVQATLATGANTTIPLSLDGVPTTVAVVVGVSSLPVGTPASTSVFVQAKDASGNIIVGPGGFSNAVSLAISGDTYGTLALSSASVTSPGQVITLNYSGGTNAGATITPSISGAAGSAATFAGSGASLTLFPSYADASTKMFPQDIVALPGAKAAALVGGWYGPCCSQFVNAIALMTTSGVQQQFTGDTTDQFNPPSSEPSYTGFTVVHGMSTQLNTETLTAYDDIAANANGIIYYSGSFSTTSDTTLCNGNTEQSGTLGVLNPATGTTTEIRLKGYAGPIKVDNTGNVWFLESNGSCNGTSLLGSDHYAIGKLAAGSSTVTETLFSSAGLSAVGHPADMSITPDGSKMFIADDNNGTVTALTTASMTASAPIVLTNSGEPTAIATAPDGTTAWFGNTQIGSSYYYGWVQGSKAFSSGNLGEAAFPISAFQSYAMAYADGSFWLAGFQLGTGIGRLSGVAAGAPVAAYYAMPIPNNNGQEVTSISAAGGYVWAADQAYGNIDVLQYGAPSNGTINYTSHVRGQASSTARRPATTPMGHHVQSKQRTAG